MKKAGKTISILVLLAILASVALVGCSQTAETTPTTVAPTAVPTNATAATTPAASDTATTASGVTISGLVTTPITVSAADLKNQAVKITVDGQDYNGARINALLDQAQVKTEATSVTLTGADGYAKDVQLSDLKSSADCILAIDDQGAVQMAVLPGLAKGNWVKNVAKIEVK